MYKIKMMRFDQTLVFAAEELKKYLRMMMPECGEIEITLEPGATDGFRLGLLSDFGLPFEGEDDTLDDVVHVDTTPVGGILAGSNPRSTLFAAYRLLKLHGCRFLYPGIDGEFIPVREKLEAKFYHKMADMRYRGQCNEGAEYQPNMMESIDFTAKIDLNIFMIEFFNPRVYYDWYYNHQYNEDNREPEPVTPETILQWKRECEAEIRKRGLQYHDMGHGWTSEPFGIDSSAGWVSHDMDHVPKESVKYLAMLNGERKLFKGIPLNTNVCFSNPEARTIIAKAVVAYAEKATNVDFLHVWGADADNNHCECEECMKRPVSDYWIMLMNEIDELLTEKGMNTRIVVCAGKGEVTTCKLNNPKRFLLQGAPTTRSYAESPSVGIPKPEFPIADHRNKMVLPKSLDAYVGLWQKIQMQNESKELFVYEYHLWRHQHYAPGLCSIAKILFNDIEGYYKNGMKGIIQDCSQRSFFPNGLLFHLYGTKMFDLDADFDAIVEDYFTCAYGENWKTVWTLFTEMDAAFGNRYMEGLLSADEERSKFYNPAYVPTVLKAKEVAEKYRDLVWENRNQKYRSQTVSFRLLWRYLEFVTLLANVLALKAGGQDVEANEAFADMMNSFGKYELEMERYYDHALVGQSLRMVVRILGTEKIKAAVVEN